MPSQRSGILVNFALRVAYGVFMLSTPARVGTPWVGQLARTPASEVPMRGIGGREVAVHVAGGAAILAGAPARPWLWASLGGDLTDIATALATRRHLPRGGLRSVLFVGGGSAAWTSILLIRDGADR